jgi:cysteine desulfurase
VSAGSACASGSIEASYVLRALGVPAARAHGTLRFGLSRFTTADEIDRAIAIVRDRVERLRSGRAARA